MTENETLPCVDCISFPRCVSRTTKRGFAIYALINECPMLYKYLAVKESTSYSLTTDENMTEELFQQRRDKIKKYFELSTGILDTHYEKYGVKWVR